MTTQASPASRFDVLLECCRKAEELVSPATGELPALLELAEHHAVLPQLFARVASGKVDEISRACDANTRRALWFASELKRIVAAFTAAGIQVLPYKGPVLAAQLYGDVTKRSCSDLDFLIRPRDLNGAERLLGELGYQAALKLTPRQRQSYVSSGYEMVFDSKLGRNLVELHWHVAPRFYCVDIELNGLFERACRVDVAGTSIMTLSQEDSLIVLAVHGAKHLWPRLSMLRDLAGVAQLPGMDWERVLAQARKLHLERLLAVGLQLIQRLLGVEIPRPALPFLTADRDAPTLAKQLARDMRRGILIDPESFTYFRRFLGLRERWFDRARMVSHLAFTPSVGEWDAVKLPDSVFPLYRAVRISRLVGRILPASRRT